MNEKAEHLRAKAARLAREADELRRAAQVEINDLLEKARLIELGSDVVKAAKLAELEAEADAAREEDRRAFAAQKLAEREAMAARGEAIEVPKDVDAMLAILDAQERGGGKDGKGGKA